MKAPGPLHKLRALVRAAEDPRLHETDMKVLVVLVDTIGKTGTGWWGFGTIAKRIGKHRTAVIRSIALLESLGHIRCHRTGGGGPANTTRYEIVEASTSSADATSSVHATSSTDAPDQSHPRTEPVAPTHHESVRAFESVEAEQSGKEDAFAIAPAPSKGQASRSKSKLLTFRQWSDGFSEDEQCIPNDHSVFAYAKRVGLPDEFLDLAWVEFSRRHMEATKRQKSWPQTFENYVRGNYLRLWHISSTGEYYLSDAGKQLAIEEGNFAAQPRVGNSPAERVARINAQAERRSAQTIDGQWTSPAASRPL